MKSAFLYWLVRTDASLGAMVARLTLGIIFLPIGLQKLLGAFGGPGLSATLNMFVEKQGIPKPLAFLVVMAESFGALGLILGVLGRFCAFGTGLVMLGAVFLVHLKKDGWLGSGYQLALLGLSLAVMIQGSGAFSFDRWLTQRMHKPNVPAA